MTEEITTLQAKERAKKALLDIPGVVGVGTGTGSSDFVSVYVKELTPQIREQIPKELDGIPTRVIETGELKALRTSKRRPAQPGISIGNVGISAGTFGFVGRDRATGRRVIISNSHVFVSDPTKSTISDTSVVQPGVADGGRSPTDKLADTVKWVPLSMVGPNLVDGAVALPLRDEDISDEILNVGRITGVATAVTDMQVKKSGRSSGLNTGTVIDTNATIKVGYRGFYATFDDVFLTTGIGIPGDSGSAVLTADNKIVGLLFAGSDKITCICKIHNVMNSLGITISGFAAPPTAAASWILLPLILGGLYMLWKGGI